MTYGLRAGVRVSDPAVLDRVKERLPPDWEPACSPFVDYLYSLKVGGTAARRNVRNYHLLYFGLQRIARTMDLNEALETLEGHLQIQVAVNAYNRVMIHAEVVGWRGRALVISGYSRAGKSTLVAELLRLGATYYSDEYAVLDGHGLVHRYARRLSLRQEGDLPSRRCTAADLGAETEAAPRMPTRASHAVAQNCAAAAHARTFKRTDRTAERVEISARRAIVRAGSACDSLQPAATSCSPPTARPRLPTSAWLEDWKAAGGSP